jgi:hypothetical protein
MEHGAWSIEKNSPSASSGQAGRKQLAASRKQLGTKNSFDPFD